MTSGLTKSPASFSNLGTTQEPALVTANRDNLGTENAWEPLRSETGPCTSSRIRLKSRTGVCPLQCCSMKADNGAHSVTNAQPKEGAHQGE